MDNSANTNSFNINSFNNFVNTTIADDKPQVLQWLSPLEPQNRHQHLRENRLRGVGQWIFQTEEFRRWNTGEEGSSHPVLFCHGDPGVGKTHLSSLVIDHFYGGGPEVTVAGLYCDYLDRKEQTTSNMLGAMLKQLAGSGNIPEDIRKAFDRARAHFGGVGLEVPELLNMLKSAISRSRLVVICIDGLDESLEGHRNGLLRSLQAIVRDISNVRLFLTGRPFIRSEVEKYFPGVDTISVTPTKEDTEALLRMKLEEDTEFDAMDERLRDDIMEIIPKTISEVFLLVSLSIEAILAETTVYRRRQKLQQVSSGHDVGDVYSATLERIRAQKRDRSRLGMEAIMWVAHSERPLRPEELCHALGVELGSNDENSDNIPSVRTILNCGLGLVTVDSSSSTVRLVHFTLQEYILANPTLFHSPHSAIAEVCLTYLNFECIRSLSPTLRSPPPETPFLEYASCFWGTHARRETSKSVISLALDLLDRFDAHISRKPLLEKEDFLSRGPFDIGESAIGFTGLHGAAVVGVIEILVSLFRIKKWDINATDLRGDTVLMLAALNGHDEVVKILLEQEGINPDMADTRGQTALSWASQNGHEGIVKMLVGRNDVNPNRADNLGETPLFCATSFGHGGVVEVLLMHSDVNPCRADNLGQTPLLLAALEGDVGIVKLLLERSDINPDTAGKDGETPLFLATRLGWEEIVKMLLKRSDVNPDTPDSRGRTALSSAAMFGDEEIVKILLGRSDVNPDTADGGGETPLSLAAKYGRESVVKMLLKRSDVNPDTQDNKGRTPLLRATEGGCEEVVEVLLERDDVDPNWADKTGRTPLSWASEKGYEGIVMMLLERNNDNPATEDKNGGTPLSWASGNGCTGVVQLLEEQCDPTTKSELTEQSSAPFTIKSPELAEPPAKRVRFF